MSDEGLRVPTAKDGEGEGWKEAGGGKGSYHRRRYSTGSRFDSCATEATSLSLYLSLFIGHFRAHRHWRIMRSPN